MSINLNAKIMLSIASIAAAAALVVGATFAYFSDVETSSGNVFASGTLSIDITDQNADTPFSGEAVVSNWAPGDESLVNFDIKNVGTLPVNIRGFAAGTWGSTELDSQGVVKVTKVERWNGSSWDTLATNPAGITGYFYDSNDGTSTGTLFDVAAGGRTQLQLTVLFDSGAGNDFQGQTFTASLQAEAKQLSAPSWP